MKTIDQTLAAFTFASLQTFRNIILTLGMEGKTIDEALQYIVRIEEQYNHRKFPERLCDDCQTPMRLYSVNTTDCNKVNGNFKSQWFCPECWESEFVKETIEELVKKENEDGI